MLTFEKLPIDQERLAELLGERLGLDLPALGIEAGEATLHDSARVWIVEDPANDRPLAEQATATDTWHHQIWVDGEPRLWVRSRSGGEEGWHIGEIVASPVALTLEKALGELDQTGLEVGEIRYLIVPRRQLEAIWVRRPGGDRLIVLAAPPSVREALGETPGPSEPVELEVHPAAGPAEEAHVEVPASDESSPRLVTDGEFVSGLQSIPDLFGLRAEVTDTGGDG